MTTQPQAHRPLLFSVLLAAGLFLAGFVLQVGILLTGLPGSSLLVVLAGYGAPLFGLELGDKGAVIASCFIAGFLLAACVPLVRLGRLVAR